MTRIAVTGANGRVGRQVIDLLSRRHDIEVVAIVRDRWRHAPRPRLQVAVADYDDSAAVHRALRGIDVLVLVTSDGPAAQVLVHHQTIVAAASAAPVDHVVALSSQDADARSPFCYAVTNHHTERALAASGIAATVARASIFSEFFAPWIHAAAPAGDLRLPAAAGRVAFVSRSDVAQALAVLATTTPGGVHVLTGPQALDMQAAAALAPAPVRFVDISPGQHHRDMALAGTDPWWAYAYASMFASIRQQRWAGVSADLARLIGHAPASLREVLRSAR